MVFPKLKQFRIFFLKENLPPGLIQPADASRRAGSLLLAPFRAFPAITKPQEGLPSCRDGGTFPPEGGCLGARKKLRRQSVAGTSSPSLSGLGAPSGNSGLAGPRRSRGHTGAKPAPAFLPSCFGCVWLFVILWTVARRLLCPWDSPGKNTGGGCHFLLQGIFLTQGSNPHL